MRLPLLAARGVRLAENIVGGVDVAFGASTQPAGHLPVNVPALDASNNFATEVQFARGFGL